MCFRRILPNILCWCLCANIAAQTTLIDSLEQILTAGKGSHTEKAEWLIRLSKEYKEVDSTKSRTYAAEAIKHAKNAGSETLEGAAYMALGNIYTTTYRHYLAHVNYKKAENLFLKQKDNKKDLQTVYLGLMLLFYTLQDVENAIYYGEKLLELVESDQLETEIKAMFFIGWAKYFDTLSQEKLDYFLNLYEKALPLNNLFPILIAEECGEIYLRMNRPRESLNFLYRSLHYRNSKGRKVNSIYYGMMAEAYAHLNMKDSADYFMKQAWIKNYFFDDPETKKSVSHSQSVVDSYKSDYKNALEYFKKYHHLSDSIAKALKTTEIARMKNWHELEQKDNENRLLQHEKQKQHRLIRILQGALLMIIALLTLSVFLYRKTAEKNRELKQLHTVKDKLFSVVAHDLRSPMGALMSMLNLANENEIDAETQAQLLKDISVRVDDTYRLLDNLLHWSKSQMQGMIPAPALFDAQDGSRAVTDSLQSIAAHKNIVLNNRIQKQQIFADRDMFAVVVRNLTMNAIKYTPEVGEITLASELKDNMLIISVKDNGTGMPQEVQDKLFKLSETQSKRGTNNESGTGLGLVLCADFVKINGGNIWFTSAQGEGSTFYFSVPVK